MLSIFTARDACHGSSSRAFHRRSGRGAFSLVEVLTAVAVLSLLMALMGQALNTISGTLRDGQRRVNNFSKARVMLDIMARDLQAGLYRSDLAFFPNGDFAFYTMGAGVPAGAELLRNVSLVMYKIDLTTTDSVLQRGDLAIQWEDGAGEISFGDTDALPRLGAVTFRDTTPGVLGFMLVFICADGSRSFSYTRQENNPLRVIGITLAVIDDQTIQRLQDGQIRDLREKLKNIALGGSGCVRADWENYLRGGGMNWSSYPKQLATGLKVFERYVYIPGN